MADQENEKAPLKKHFKRSPGYPFINLETAVGRATTFYSQHGDRWADPEIAVTFWGYSTKSSGGRQTLAALKHYGLLKTRDDGRVALSDRGLDIVMPGSPRKLEALKGAALEPEEFRKLWDAHGEALGHEQQLRFELVRDQGFNQKAVGDFIQNYRDTIRYAGLKKSATMPAETRPDGGGADHGGEASREAAHDIPSFGDLIQWESEGVEQFLQPRRVRAVAAGEWVFVDGSETGLPVSQVTVVGKAPEEPRMPAMLETPKARPTLPLAGTELLSLSIPFRGKTLSVQIRSEGEPLRSAHVAKVIKHLELSKEDLDPPAGGE